MPPRRASVARKSPAARRRAASPPPAAQSDSEQDSGSESEPEPQLAPEEEHDDDDSDSEDSEDELAPAKPTPEWVRLGAVALVALIVAGLFAQALSGLLEGLPYQQAIVRPSHSVGGGGDSTLSGADVLVSARQAAAIEAERLAEEHSEQLRRDLAQLRGDLEFQAKAGQTHLHELRAAMATKLEVSSNGEDVAGLVAALESRIAEQSEAARRTRDELARLGKSLISRDELRSEVEQSQSLAASDFLRSSEGALREWVREECGGALSADGSLGQSHLSSNVRHFVHEHVGAEIDKLYADNTGMVDYAHKGAGGSVVSSRTSPSYMPADAYWVTRGLHAMGVISGTEPADTVISSHSHVGACYPMAGDHGEILVRLTPKTPVAPTSFSLDHVPVSIAPNVGSAPRNVQVYGLRTVNDPAPKLLAQHEYRLDQPHVQLFDAENPKEEVYPLILLKVLDNHGDPNYTCVYRFRVHGVPVVA